MAGHARLSASQTEWWSECPGALAFIEANPRPEYNSSGYYAQMGTCAHTLVERCLGEGSEPAEYLGRLIEIVEDADGNEGTSILRKGAKLPEGAVRVIFEVDGNMVEGVECMTDYVRRRCVELGLVDEGFNDLERAREVCNLIARGTVHLEARVVPLPERDDTGGTGDVVIDAWPELLEVVDYKNGSGVFVPVEGNRQLRSYGLGALQEFGADDYERVRCTICQPNHMQAPADGIMSEEVSVPELLDWKHWLTAAADRVDAARVFAGEGATLEELYDAGFVSVGEAGKHCTFCDLASGCPASLAKAQELAAVEFDDDPADIEAPTGANHLSVVLPWVPFLDAWIKKIVTNGEHLLLTGGRIAGQKVVRKRSTGRRWITERRIAPETEGGETRVVPVTEEDLARDFAEEFGVDRGKLYTAPEPKFLTGPQAEKLLPKDKRQGFSDRYLFKPEGSLTIAPEEDSRSAVDVDPAADFDDVED